MPSSKLHRWLRGDQSKAIMRNELCICNNGYRFCHRDEAITATEETLDSLKRPLELGPKTGLRVPQAAGL